MMTGVLGGHFNLGWGNTVRCRSAISPQAGSEPLASDRKSPLGTPTFTEKGYPISTLALPHGSDGAEGVAVVSNQSLGGWPQYGDKRPPSFRRPSARPGLTSR